ncbi:MAG: hypothetical protein ACHQEM_04570 [Chitinophagales bacterium]
MGYTNSFLYQTDAAILVSLLFIGMLILIRLGSILGRRRDRKDPQKQAIENTTILAAIFGLFAFLLGFTFSMSGNRYELRRLSAVKESNAIGTAILRADLYPAEERLAYRADLKAYTQTRIDYYYSGSDTKKMDSASQMTKKLGLILWNRAATNAKNSTSIFPGNLIIPSLNEMFDAASSNDAGEKFRVPDPIVVMLFSLCLVCAFFIGYYSSYIGRYDTLITLGYCVLCALVIYITLDLDRPRSGLITHQISHQAILDLRSMFDQP